MRPLPIILTAVAAFVAWRLFARRARNALHRLRAMADSHAPRMTDWSTADTGTHSSAAAAANQDFWDDRDVTVGEKLSPIGMQPGAR